MGETGWCCRVTPIGNGQLSLTTVGGGGVFTLLRIKSFGPHRRQKKQTGHANESSINPGDLFQCEWVSMGGWYFEAGGHHGIMVGGEGGGHEGGAAADDEALEARELQEGRRRGGRGHAPAARGSREGGSLDSRHPTIGFRDWASLREKGSNGGGRKLIVGHTSILLVIKKYVSERLEGSSC